MVPSGLPDPFVPAEVELHGMAGFRLDVNRLLASELVAIGTPEECWAALMLWCRAWQQTPAGSLPNEERLLAAFSNAKARWPKVRAMAMRGWVECSDGRLYHRVVAEEVLKAWRKRLSYREDQDRLKRWRQAKKKDKEIHSETEFETGFKTDLETGTEPCAKQVETVLGSVLVEERKKDSEPNGSDASIDVKAIVFGQCLSWVAEKSGKAPSGLRPLFGRWCRDFGDAAVVDAVAAAQREGPVEPVAWISGKLAAGAKPKPGRPIGGFIPMHPGAGG